jgi:hypothetical protein
MRNPSDYIERTGILKVSAPGFDLNYRVRIVTARQDDDKLRLLVANAAGGPNMLWFDADEILLDEGSWAK